MKTAVLLINLGSPKDASRKTVGKFLYQMLNDKYVIDLPFVLRKLLVNLIIIPFRINASSKKYREYFAGGNSPLLEHSFSVERKLNKILSEDIRVFFAGRYGNPSLKDALKKIHAEKFEQIIVFPQYPQYAEATTLSTLKKSQEILSKLKNSSKVFYIDNFHNNPLFITCLSKKIKQYNPNEYDHVVFSYHSLPLRQLNKVHVRFHKPECRCSEKTSENSSFCYKAACYETSELLAEKLGLNKENYTTSFQSKMGKKWLHPFTDSVLITNAKKGNKRILIVSPSFVTDCLETTEELGVEYNELFIRHGGLRLQLTACLNDDDEWVQTLANIIIDKIS